MSNKGTIGIAPPGGGPGTSGNAAKKDKYAPSDATKAIVGEIVTKLEGLPPKDRGYVLARITELYSVKGKESRTTDSKAESASTTKPTLPSKTEWKTEWEKTEEYSAWQNAIKSKAPPEVYKPLQVTAFRKRNEIRTTYGLEPTQPAESADSVGTPPTAEAEGKKEETETGNTRPRVRTHAQDPAMQSLAARKEKLSSKQRQLFSSLENREPVDRHTFVNMFLADKSFRHLLKTLTGGVLPDLPDGDRAGQEAKAIEFAEQAGFDLSKQRQSYLKAAVAPGAKSSSK